MLQIIWPKLNVCPGLHKHRLVTKNNTISTLIVVLIRKKFIINILKVIFNEDSKKVSSSQHQYILGLFLYNQGKFIYFFFYVCNEYSFLGPYLGTLIPRHVGRLQPGAPGTASACLPDVVVELPFVT